MSSKLPVVKIVIIVVEPRNGIVLRIFLARYKSMSKPVSRLSRDQTTLHGRILRTLTLICKNRSNSLRVISQAIARASKEDNA